MKKESNSMKSSENSVDEIDGYLGDSLNSGRYNKNIVKQLLISGDDRKSRPPKYPDIHLNNFQIPDAPNQQNNECNCKRSQKYSKLLEQYNKYRQQSRKQKQKQLQELIKYREHINRTYKQMESKFEQKVTENNKQYLKKINSLQKKYQQKIIKLEEKTQSDSQKIQQLRNQVRDLQMQKLEIIENNTKMLYQISRNDQLWNDDDQNQESSGNIGAKKGIYKNSYQQLIKLYQFVLQQNNGLKKQIYKLNNNSIIQHQLSIKKNQKETNLQKKKKVVPKNKKLNASVTSHQQSIKIKTPNTKIK